MRSDRLQRKIAPGPYANRENLCYRPESLVRRTRQSSQSIRARIMYPFYSINRTSNHTRCYLEARMSRRLLLSRNEGNNSNRKHDATRLDK